MVRAADADSLDLEAHHGQVVYLDFWASWCVPCRTSFPWMNAMHLKYESDGLDIISVNVDNDRKAADKFLQKYPAHFAVFFDPKGKLASSYDLKAMPSSFLYDRDGKLIRSYLGFHEKDEEQLELDIKTLLKEAPKDSADAPASPR